MVTNERGWFVVADLDEYADGKRRYYDVEDATFAAVSCGFTLFERREDATAIAERMSNCQVVRLVVREDD